MSNTTRFSKAWIVYCLLFAITVQSSSPGVVLCFKNDGHIEIEFGSNERCCQAFNYDSHESLTFIARGQNCNNPCRICVDIPLYITSEKKHNGESSVLDELVSLLQTAPYTTPFIDQSTSRNTFPTIPATAFHVSTIQTVIIQV